ncbi:MAG: helix-turn-helix domain-containing protein [Chloroflexi bacterium]|uniref:Helix-turn-helix domain-containing protein n=1 Tax=Candidatus Chlorohelix allophototropha TaxID=3003348 RepID=A0A8T7M4F2_9CHLR|nr:helix-turn-helix domain-containing protein [Chloroflexota bacterium]WJW70045.1 helix-turn-helix domain-containing protein [Chloroflexota bacterium L227-S17]
MPSLQKKQAQIEVADNSTPTSSQSEHFVQIPVNIIANPNLTPAALKLYLVLMAYCGPKPCAWPSQARLAEEMHITERRVRDLLKELTDEGLITVAHHMGATNTYYVDKHRVKKQPVPPLPVAQPEIYFRGEEENSRRDRKYISAYIHELNHVCEEPLSEIAFSEIEDTDNATPLPEVSFPAPTPETGEMREIRALLAPSGLSESLIQELAVFVTSKNRDVEYVKRIVQASQVSGIHNPPGYVRYMLLNNAEPVPVKESKSVKESRERKSQPKSPAAIDFSKYAPGGKYGYLVRATDTESPILGDGRGRFVPEAGSYAPRL